MEDPLKIDSLKRMTIPKGAVLATGRDAAPLVAAIQPTPPQASPTTPQDAPHCRSPGPAPARTQGATGRACGEHAARGA